MTQHWWDFEYQEASGGDLECRETFLVTYKIYVHQKLSFSPNFPVSPAADKGNVLIISMRTKIYLPMLRSKQGKC